MWHSITRAICAFPLIISAIPALAAPSGQWAFDEISGNAAADSSGNGLNFTLYGSPSWVPGQAGNALSFNGINTYGRVDDSPLLDGSGALSISLWVKPTGLDGNPQFLVSKRTGVLQNCAYALFFGEGNKLNVDVDYNTGGTGTRFQGNTVFANDQWYHVMLVFDGAAHRTQRARVYVNGTLDRDVALVTTSISDKASPLYIGTGEAGYAYKFKGLMDDLVISKEIPSETELASAHQGMWTLDKWTSMPYKEIGDLTADPRFLGEATSRELVREAGKNLDWYRSGGRLRGRIQVPSTGKYLFWLTARTSAGLLISSDSNPYQKRRIAYMSPASGTGDGITYTASNQWDQYASQMSEPILLEEGESYYIEVLAQVSLGDKSQVRLAWAPEGGLRSEIPASALSYYLIPPEDLDDDSLPDAWEAGFGLSTTDNGFSDIAKEGERGDFDGDGLTNREEYLLGTNPALADSDGDGLTDYDEVHTYLTNPSASDLPAESVVSSINLEGFVASTWGWTMIEGGLLSDAFRGSIEWDIPVTTAGTWIIQAGTRLLGKLQATEMVEVHAYIDGNFAGTYQIAYDSDHEGLLRIITPHLAQGTHRLKLDIDNRLARRTVQILSLEVRQPTGSDTDSDGVPDWVEAMIGELDKVDGHSANSRISPFCLEGIARDSAGVLVSGTAAEEGSDSTHWFKNLSLDPVNATSYSVAFRGGETKAGSIFWQTTNVLDGGSMPVRAGDSLKLGAWNAGGTGSATIVVGHSHPDLLASKTSGVIAETTTPALGAGAIRVPSGANQHMTITDSDELDDTDKLEISFWAKPDASSFDGLARGMVSKRLGVNDGSAYSIFMFTGGRLFVDIDNGTTAPLRVDSGHVMSTSWQHVRVVYDGTLPAAQRLEIHVDGVLKTTASVPVSSIRNFAANTTIGIMNYQYQSGGVPVSFGGLLDDVSITRHIPSSQESTTVKLDFNDPADLLAQQNTKQESTQVAGTASFVSQFQGTHDTYTIAATHSGGSTGQLTVQVLKAEFPPPISVLENTLRYWTLDSNTVGRDLILEPGANLRLGARQEIDAVHYRHSVHPLRNGRLGVAARLWEAGPIAGIARFSSIGMSASAANDLVQSWPSDFRGYHITTSPLLVTDLPAGGTVKLVIFRAGIYFFDGSTEMTLSAADFENGLHLMRFLVMDGLEAGFCHYLDVYDANGNWLARQ